MSALDAYYHVTNPAIIVGFLDRQLRPHGLAVSLSDPNDIESLLVKPRRRPPPMPGASAHEAALVDQVARLETVIVDKDGHIALLKGLLRAARRALPNDNPTALEIDRALA